MSLTIGVSLLALVILNFLLLAFSCNKTTVVNTKESVPPIKDNGKVAKISEQAKLAS